jgi:hypothetical protein
LWTKKTELPFRKFFKLSFGQTDWSRTITGFGYWNDLGDRDVAVAKNDFLALLELGQIFRQMSFCFVDVELDHDFKLNYKKKLSALSRKFGDVFSC